MMFQPPPASYRLIKPFVSIDGVPCLWSSGAHAPKNAGIIMYLHGNGNDIGQLGGHADMIARATQHSVVLVEYPGYGPVPGTATPTGCVQAARTVYMHLRAAYPSRPIVILGQSIGTGVALALVSDPRTPDPAAVVLVSAFESIASLAKDIAGPLGGLVAGDVYNSKRAIGRVRVPTLLVHGLLDTLIPPRHSRTLLEASPASRKDACWLPDSTHNDIDWVTACAAITRFLSGGAN
jgi:pimeloyl-ACP methyl ester carboxylesterase